MRPSPKQIKMAEELGAKHGVKAPSSIYDDALKCAEFIAKYYKPTKAQLEYAEAILEKGGAKPEKIFENMTPAEINKYIKENQKIMPTPVTDKTRNFAMAMAFKMNLDKPNMEDDEEVREFIRIHKEEFENKFPKGL